MIDAGEHLFARHGVHRVTVRELNERAGQRNASALHYHFGSRDGLLRAIVERHQSTVDARRAELLAATTDPDTAELVRLVLAPLAEELRSPSGRDYLRIVPQLLEMEGVTPPTLAVVTKDLTARLDHPHRLTLMLLAATTLLADRAAHPRRDGRPHAEFVDELVAMSTAMLLA